MRQRDSYIIAFLTVSGVEASSAVERFPCRLGLAALRPQFASIHRVLGGMSPARVQEMPEVVEAMRMFEETQSRFGSLAGTCDADRCELAVMALGDFVNSDKVQEAWPGIRSKVDTALHASCDVISRPAIGNLRRV